MQKTKVAIVKCDSYNRNKVQNAINRCIELCGGIRQFIGADSKVLLKPNLLAPKTSDKAVTTHPEIIFAIGNIVKKYTDTILIGDSPGYTSAIKVMEKCGIADAVRELKIIKMINFQETKKTKHDQSLTSIELSSDCLGADHIINIAKLKTHAQMLMTLAVKNLFGCVVGVQKAQWHFRAGVDYDHFARIIVDVCRSINPTFNIVDGIIGMEGDGPGNGIPRNFGTIIAGENPFAVDLVISKMVGIRPEEVYTTKIAQQLNIFGSNENDIEIVGETLDNSKIETIIRPKNSPLIFGPGILQQFLRKQLMAQPIIKHSKCIQCMVCTNACPAKVMTLKTNKIKIDYKKCIRCFCCLEVCPHNAINTRQTLLYSFLKNILRLR